jgi:hypothetical protein
VTPPPPGKLAILLTAAGIALSGFVSMALGAYWASTAPARAEWEAAAAHVRAGLAAGDVVAVAPWWADEARLALGDGPVLARPDIAGEVAAGGLWRYRRLWLVAAPGLGGGAGTAGDRIAALRTERPEAAARFGRVEVRLFELGETPAPYDFLTGIAAAEVWVEKGAARVADCSAALPDGTGFRCTPSGGEKVAHWGKVERRIREIDDGPRECLEAHPWPGASLVLRFPAVALGRTLVVEGGMPLAALRELERKSPAPVELRALVAGKDLGMHAFPTAPGWTRLRLDTTAVAPPGSSADVTFRIAAPDIEWRFFCFTAHTEGA